MAQGRLGWWNWAAMTLVMVSFWGLIAWLVVAAVRPASPQASPSPRAEDILGERFAAGEIDDEEHRRRLDVVREGTDPDRPSKVAQIPPGGML